MIFVRKTLDKSYAFCRRLTRRSGSNFYQGIKILPREKRRAMEALYAFMRHTDDIVDAPPDRMYSLDETIDRRRWLGIFMILIGFALVAMKVQQ